MQQFANKILRTVFNIFFLCIHKSLLGHDRQVCIMDLAISRRGAEWATWTRGAGAITTTGRCLGTHRDSLGDIINPNSRETSKLPGITRDPILDNDGWRLTQPNCRRKDGLNQSSFGYFQQDCHHGREILQAWSQRRWPPHSTSRGRRWFQHGHRIRWRQQIIGAKRVVLSS